MLARNGARGAVTARSRDALADVIGVVGNQQVATQLDVRSTKTIQAAVDLALSTFGRIDVLVNNAAVSLLGAVEEVTEDEIQMVLETNLLGPIHVTRAVLPHMRARRAGHVISVSSVGGFQGAPGLGIYSASKFGLEGVMESLAAEVAPVGIKVSLVEPGRISSGMRGPESTIRTLQQFDDYAESSGRTRAAMDAPQKPSAISPDEVALRILELTTLDVTPLRLPVGDGLPRIRDKVESLARELSDLAEAEAARV
jgi:NAD(P)-dependent dehydrogenase (short-subunit alcohol dehydrogenase family)